jgi:hypothetical protein
MARHAALFAAAGCAAPHRRAVVGCHSSSNIRASHPPPRLGWADNGGGAPRWPTSNARSDRSRPSAAVVPRASATPRSSGTRPTRHLKLERCRVVIGTRMTVPNSDLFSASVDTTRHGRTPRCSRPRLGLRSTSQISPRRGFTRPGLRACHRAPR